MDTKPMTAPAGRRPRVVVVGAGFGGLSAAKGLAGSAFDVTVIDRHNYHLFQPLLYQVATAGLSPADIASPIRGILRDAEERHRGARQGFRRRYRQQGGHRRRPPDSVRLPGDRDRRASTPISARRLGILCAGPEDHRRRHLSAPPHPARVRARRDRNRSRRAPPAVEFRRGRRRTDRRRDGRRHRRARQARAGDGLPLDRSALDAHHPGRGRAAPAGAVRSRACRRRRGARSSNSASKCVSARRSPTATAAASRSATSESSRAPSCGRPA